jgi:ABC-type multidrug transport system fused ATPase/permease subunit
VTEAVNGMVLPTIRLLAQMIVISCIVGLLVVLDPTLALLTVIALGGTYALLFFVVRRKQSRLGDIRFAANKLRFKAAAEAFGSIKETKVFAREHEFLSRFAAPTQRLTRAHIANQVLTEIPRHGLETIAFGGILVVVLYMLSTQEEPSQAIAVMGLYALAGYRLIPAFQHIFDSMTKFRFYSPVLGDLIRDLESFPPPPERTGSEQAEIEPLRFEFEILIENVTFAYPTGDRDVLRDLTLRIPKHTTVGFVGSTGAGKTTLIDVLLGLLTPQQGSVQVDGVPITEENLVAWRRQVGYVPQTIYLCDDTIQRNIAFGLADADIDPERVEWAARLAHLHEFVESLPERYETLVGERGIRLSGGQRQRIGIARAAYHNPDVLILDEGTSALDGITEDVVMDAIRELAGRKTILLIAHRVSTLRDCDAIHVMADGEIVDSGSYNELWARNAHFRAMAKTKALDAASA